MSCYILKKGITGAMYTINRQGKPTVVAFKDGKQAGTYRRLINEMGNLNHSNEIKVERVNLLKFVSMCNNSSLDVIQIDNTCADITYSTPTMNTDDMRFVLENKFRYGY